jgi:hypothetical protein
MRERGGGHILKDEGLLRCELMAGDRCGGQALELADGMERERNEMRAKMKVMEQREEELRKRSKKLEVCVRTPGRLSGPGAQPSKDCCVKRAAGNSSPASSAAAFDSPRRGLLQPTTCRSRDSILTPLLPPHTLLSLCPWQAEGAADFLKRVQEAESDIASVVRELQQSGGSFKDVDAARARIGKLQAGVMEDLDTAEVRWLSHVRACVRARRARGGGAGFLLCARGLLVLAVLWRCCTRLSWICSAALHHSEGRAQNHSHQTALLNPPAGARRGRP